MKKKVIIIGGGAAGIAAAIFAARAGAQVTILEHTAQIGKKLLSTGNGRCNLTNSHMDPACFRSSSPDFPMEAVNAFCWEDTLSWFASMGVICHSRMGTYYYPMSDQAGAVLDCLKLELKKEQICVETEVEIKNIQISASNEKKGFRIQTSGRDYFGEALILACGSKAAPSTGSDGSGYELAKGLGHKIKKPLPALVQLRCQGGHYRQLAGIRTDAGLTLFCSGKKMWEERGELQLTDYGISGIPVFQLSRFAAMALDAKEKVVVSVDFLPAYSEGETRELLEKRFEALGDRKGEDFLTGLFHKKLALVLMKLAGIRPDQPVKTASAKQREALLLAVKHYEALVSSVNPFTNAQVCCGGVDVSQVDPLTMESKLVPGLYFAGELLDVDGICGGYNLQWAWSSGYAAGTYAAGAGPVNRNKKQSEKARSLR